MKAEEQIISTLRQLMPKLRETYRVKTMSVFGSVARGQEEETSDIDVLVEFEEDADLLHMAGLGAALEEELGRRVDVVSARALRREIRDSVLSEAVAV
jgi:hypothetical protein